MRTEIFKTSKQGTVVVANALIGKDTFCHVSHLDALNEPIAKFTHERQRSIRRALDNKR